MFEQQRASRILLDPAATMAPARTDWGEQSHTRLSSQDTNGVLAIIDYRAPAGFGPPRHIHQREDEIFHVLEGHAVVWTPDNSFVVGPGDLVSLPMGLAHTWRAFGDQPVHFTLTVTPGGFEAFFPTIEQRGLTLENVRGLTDMAAEMGINMIGPPLSDEDVEQILRSHGG